MVTERRRRIVAALAASLVAGGLIALWLWPRHPFLGGGLVGYVIHETYGGRDLDRRSTRRQSDPPIERQVTRFDPPAPVVSRRSSSPERANSPPPSNDPMRRADSVPSTVRAVVGPPVEISTGLVGIGSGSERIAPFEVQAAAGEDDYFVKLEDALSGDEYLTAYVEGGDTLTLEVGLGTYILKYCSGAVWYGIIDRFGPHESCQRADSKFTFRKELQTVSTYQVSGYRVELIQQVNGNLPTSEIPRDSF